MQPIDQKIPVLKEEIGYMGFLSSDGLVNFSNDALIFSIN